MRGEPRERTAHDDTVARTDRHDDDDRHDLDDPRRDDHQRRVPCADGRVPRRARHAAMGRRRLPRRDDGDDARDGVARRNDRRARDVRFGDGAVPRRVAARRRQLERAMADRRARRAGRVRGRFAAARDDRALPRVSRRRARPRDGAVRLRHRAGTGNRSGDRRRAARGVRLAVDLPVDGPVLHCRVGTRRDDAATARRSKRRSASTGSAGCCCSVRSSRC